MLLRMCYVHMNYRAYCKVTCTFKRYLVLETSMIFYYFEMSECNLHNLLTAGIKYVTTKIQFRLSIRYKKKIVLAIFQSLILINLL